MNTLNINIKLDQKLDIFFELSSHVLIEGPLLLHPHFMHLWTILWSKNLKLKKKLFIFSEGDGDADKKEKVEDVENAEPVAS